MGGFARGCKHQNEQNLYIPTHVYDFGSRNSTLRHSTFSSRFPAVRGLGKQFPAVRGLGVHVTELGVRESAFPTALKHKVSNANAGRKVFKGGVRDCAASARRDWICCTRLRRFVSRTQEVLEARLQKALETRGETKTRRTAHTLNVTELGDRKCCSSITKT